MDRAGTLSRALTDLKAAADVSRSKLPGPSESVMDAFVQTCCQPGLEQTEAFMKGSQKARYTRLYLHFPHTTFQKVHLG